jgi:hypothetical protein
MKKVLFTFLALTLATAGVFAQLSGGLKAGLNLANQVYSSNGISASPDSRASFHVGGYLNFAPSEKFSIQPELLFSGAGAKINSDQLKMSYITVPVMFKYNPTSIFNIQAGPQVGFLLSAKDDAGDDVKDQFKSLDLGAAFGLGVDLPMGLNFTARYVFGLSDISDASSDFGDVKIKNTTIQLSVGYRLFGGE